MPKTLLLFFSALVFSLTTASILEARRATTFDIPDPSLSDISANSLREIRPCLEEAAAANPEAWESVLATLATLDLRELNEAYQQFDPALYNVFNYAGEAVSEKVRSAYTRHGVNLHEGSAFCWTLWTTLFAERVQQKAISDTTALSGYNDRFLGFLVAADLPLKGKLLVTPGFSYARSQLDWVGASANASIDSYIGSLAAYWDTRPWCMDAYFSYAYSRANGERNISVLSQDLEAASSIDLTTESLSSSQAYTGHFGIWAKKYFCKHGPYLSTFANFDYVFVRQSRFQESDVGVLTLDIHPQQSDLFRPEVGFRFGFDGCLSSIENAFFELGLSVTKDFRFQGKFTSANFIDNTCTFRVKGLFPRYIFVCPSVNCGIAQCCGMNLCLGYQGAFGSSYAENDLSLEITLPF